MVLLELRIENLLLIERAELRFGSGLNALTGETGAGKTVLAHSLDLIMGGKARPQIVRPGASEAYVEGVFEMPDGLLEEAELRELAERLPAGATELVLGRRVSAAGRTSAFLQGRSATATDLKLLGSRLLSFYGQHEHRRLTLGSTQLETLDGFAGDLQLQRRRAYRAAHGEVVVIERELAELGDRQGARERDLDLLRFELREIEDAGPDHDEQIELAGERLRLRHAEGLRAAGAAAHTAIAGESEDGDGGASALAAAESGLAAVDGVDPELDRLAERVRAAAVDLADLAAELRGYVEGIEAEPGRLEQVEERLEVIDRLMRKHGGSIDAVLEHADRCRAEVARIEGAEERAGELEAALVAASQRRADLGSELSKARATSARKLEQRVAAELEQLSMAGARLEVRLGSHPQGFGPNGSETVEFMIATNPGLPISPLREAASGGELSRVMLALAGLGGAGGSSTLVFDEIDAGVGGSTARSVGERLRALGRGRQVLCITHLAQVASVASTHFRIHKSVGGGQVLTTVERVEGDALVAEIVRMLGAKQGDETADRHARELLAAA